MGNDSDYISHNIIVYQCCDWVLLCSELLQESESTGRQQEQRQSPEETGICVWRGTRCGWMCIHVCVCRWVVMYCLLKKLVCVSVGGS